MAYTDDNSILPQSDLILQSILIGMCFIGLWFFIHLLVTWNKYHRPIPPILVSLFLFLSPLLVVDYSDLTQDSINIHFMKDY